MFPHTHALVSFPVPCSSPSSNQSHDVYMKQTCIHSVACLHPQLLTDRFASGSSTSCSDLRNYCGGTFQGIIRQLDYIQGLGVNAIWISPIPQQTDTPHQGYHGFWQENIYEINSHFGTENDLKELVDACHSRGIWVMLDV